MDYGSGALFGVPGHDQRDFEFAKQYQLPIKRVVGDSVEVSADILKEGHDVLQARVHEREKGSGLQWHLNKSIVHYHEFEHSGVEDFVVETANRSVRDVALSILQGADWI